MNVIDYLENIEKTSTFRAKALRREVEGRRSKFSLYFPGSLSHSRRNFIEESTWQVERLRLVWLLPLNQWFIKPWLYGCYNYSCVTVVSFAVSSLK